MSDIDEPPPLIENDEDIDDNDDEEEEEAMFNEDPCSDLFSDKIFKSAQECLDYCKLTYGFDINVSGFFCLITYFEYINIFKITKYFSGSQRKT